MKSHGNNIDREEATMRSARKPVVSLGMPAYNSEKYIHKALDSLLAQTFTDFEIVISDDASTDRTEEICCTYAVKERRIRYIRQPRNLGSGPNHKFVLEEARGKYFRWANDDDIWDRRYLAEAVAAMEGDSSADFVVTRFRTTSRVSVLFNRLYTCDFSFVGQPAREARVDIFSRMPISSGKDNLCYALWKRPAILKVLQDIKNSPLNRILIGGASNEYALALYKGTFVDKVLWHKTFRYIPPGHYLHKFMTPIVWVWRSLRGPRRDIYYEQSRQNAPDDWPTPTENWENLDSVLSLAGFNRDFISNVVGYYKAQSGLRDLSERKIG